MNYVQHGIYGGKKKTGYFEIAPAPVYK